MSQRIESMPDSNGSRQEQLFQRKFPLYSVLIPIFFLFLHQIILNSMAYLRIFLYARNSGLAGDELMKVFTRPVIFSEYLLASEAQNYASIWAMIILIPLYLLYLFRRRRRDPLILRLQRQTISTYLDSTVLIVGTLGLTQAWMSFLLLFEEADNFFGRALRDYLIQAEQVTSAEGNLWLQIVALVILVPIAEELLFRGVFQGELSLRYSRKTRVIVSSLVFAVFHFDLIQASYVFFAGLVLSLAYELTGNLLVPIYMHIIFNFIGGGILQRLLNLDEEGSSILLIILFVFIPLALAVLLIWFRRDRAKRQDGVYSFNNDLRGKK
ncbi:MAG: CPBP family intramembrane metalloprotease [Clostridiaceae bacterium]|nr:CPBP family intramembrane metalloprotease [Clostridiaceae bacterium]